MRAATMAPPPIPTWARSRMDGMTGWWDGPNLIRDWKNSRGKFRPHSDRHDWAYGWGGTARDKIAADLQLAGGLWREGNPIHAVLVLAGVSTVGWLFWNKANRKAARLRRTWARRTGVPEHPGLLDGIPASA